MAQGVVYILINACMPGLVKIGHSTRSAVERAKELSDETGVPTPFMVAWHEEVNDCEEIERRVHARLERFRFNRKREFFSIPLKEAIEVLQKVVGEFREKESVATAEAEQRRRQKENLRKEQEKIRLEAVRQLKEESRPKQEEEISWQARQRQQGTSWQGQQQQSDDAKTTNTIRFVKKMPVQCPNCNGQYQVTFRRYEDLSCCPFCLRIHDIQIEW
jgi:hypothetical protein